MTLVLGLRCGDGVVIAADMEENAGMTAKRTVSKLTPIDYFGRWFLVAGGAGDSAAIDNAVRDLRGRFAAIPALDEERVIASLDQTLSNIHSKYIEPNPHSNGIQLILAATDANTHLLISTQDRTPHPGQQNICVGYGADLAVYFVDRLHEYWTPIEETAKLACFVLGEVKSACQYCGQASEMYVLRRGEPFEYFGPSAMAQMEAELPDFDRTLDDYAAKLRASKPTRLQRVGTSTNK